MTKNLPLINLPSYLFGCYTLYLSIAWIKLQCHFFQFKLTENDKNTHLLCYGSLEGKGDIFIILLLFSTNLDEKHDIAI